MACGCYSNGPSCVLSAIVCEGYFVIISPPNGATSISQQGNHGTATIYENYIVYEHDGDNLETDSFIYLNSSNAECVVTVTVEDTIPVNTQIMTFSATGECEIGSPTFKWTLPNDTTLVDGYTVYDAVIQVVVPKYDINNPNAQYVFLVDVCCDYCSNCCKCDTITYIPPICTTECGEDEYCYCDGDCLNYNPETGNCESICANNEICCNTNPDDIELEMLCEATITGLTWTFRSNISDGNWHLGANITLSGNCTLPSSYLTITGNTEAFGDGGYADVVSGNLIFFIETDSLGFDGQIMVGYETDTCVAWYNIHINPDSLVDNDIENYCDVITFDQLYVSGETEYPTCETCEPGYNYCAQCCDNNDCTPPAGCLLDERYCQDGVCYCLVGNVLVLAPTDGTCCPQCIDDSGLPPCYQCINDIIVPPNTNCPPNFTYNYDECLCTPNLCLTAQCEVPFGPTYCPNIDDCGCDDNICVECASVSCTATIDCPLGCMCDEDEQTCIGNPCDIYPCDNPGSPNYCPDIPNCGCEDNTDTCIPCDSVSCTATVDCPLGCACQDGTCNGPCGQLQLDCDAYIIHNESDLTFTYSYSSLLNTFTITPHLSLEPDFVFNNFNTTWEINTSNYVNGWFEIDGQFTVSGDVWVEEINGNLVFNIPYFDIPYVMIQLEVAGRKVWYRLEFISGGLSYEPIDVNLEIGGVFLCREIFTVSSLTSVPWEVTDWLTTHPEHVLYESDLVLVIDCPGSAQFEGIHIGITAEVINPLNDCEISTCPFEYECECFGSKNCDNYITDVLSDYDQSTGIWNIAIDVLYDTGVSGNEIVLLDCEFLNSLQLPTPWNCANCGTVPYNSQEYPNGIGDDVTSGEVEIPICDNLGANNGCPCVCGYTFYGAYVLEYNGAWLKLQVTNPLNAGFCYQADAAGSYNGDPCCLEYCERLHFIPECNLSIDVNVDCVAFGSYVYNVTVNGSNGTIVDITFDGLSTPFSIEGNGTYTIGPLSNEPNSSHTIVVTDSYGCTASQTVSSPCCGLSYAIEPIYCTGDTCNCPGPDKIIGYTITVTNNGLLYSLTLDTNDPTIGNNGLIEITNTTVSANTIYGLNISMPENCTDFLIEELIISSFGCTITASGECLANDCYNGLWTAVGSQISRWNTPSSISYFNYNFTGISVNGTDFIFSTPIDLKAIICQAHKEAGTSSCLDNTILTYCPANVPVTSTTCYGNPASCIGDNLPSVDEKLYHQLVANKLLTSFQCAIQSDITAINNILSSLSLPALTLVSYTQKSNLYSPNNLLPDSSDPGQLSVWKYMVITNQKYPIGLIRPIRNTTILPKKPIVTIGCECDAPTFYGYNCDACNALVIDGEYSTSGECVTGCVTDCENIYTNIVPSVTGFTVANFEDLPGFFGAPNNLHNIINNTLPIDGCYAEYGTLRLKFGFPSFPECATVTRVKFTIVGLPQADGWLNALNVGSDYAPLFGNTSYNSVITQYGTSPSGNLGAFGFNLLGNYYDMTYPSNTLPNSGVVTSILEVDLSGITTDPLTWELHLVGFGGSETEEALCDVLNSIVATLYTDCSECPGYAVPCETSDYGYECGNCTSLVYDGEYSSIDDCNSLCPSSCVTATFVYDCDTEIFSYYIETVPLDNIIDSYSATVPLGGVGTINILPDRIVVSGVTTFQDNTLTNVIVSGSISTPPWTWTYPTTFNNPLMFITIISTMTECDSMSSIIVPMMCNYGNTPVSPHIEFDCTLDVSGGVYMVDISATGGFPAYFYKLEYVVNGHTYTIQSYEEMIWWNGSTLSLSLGHILPEQITLTVVDYYNECSTVQLTPNCQYICNTEYTAPSGQLLVNILIDFSGSSAGNIISDMIADTGYDNVARLHFKAIEKLFDYYITNSALLGTNTISFKLLVYGGPGTFTPNYSPSGYTYTCPTGTVLNSAFLNTILSKTFSSAALSNYITNLNNLLFGYTNVSGELIIDGNDTIMCAIQKTFSTDNTNNKMVIVLTDKRTGGPSESCSPGEDCTNLTFEYYNPALSYVSQGMTPSINKVDTIVSGYYPYYYFTNTFHNATVKNSGFGNSTYPINIYANKYGWNRTHILNRTPEEIADFILYLINYKLSNNQLPCITVGDDYVGIPAYASCDEACDPPVVLGYECEACNTPVINGIYGSPSECIEICPGLTCGWGATSSCGMLNDYRIIDVSIDITNSNLIDLFPITLHISGCTNEYIIELTEVDFTDGIYTLSHICLGTSTVTVEITDNLDCVYSNIIPYCGDPIPNLCEYIDGNGEIILIPEPGDSERYIYVPNWSDGDSPDFTP